MLFACGLCACGRIGFDPNGANNGDDVASIDASGDGAMSNGAEMPGDPAAWTKFLPGAPTSADLYSVWAFSASDVWIAGAGGVTYQYNGASWVTRSGPVQDVYMLWGMAPNDLWAIGRLCDVQRWNGAAWSPVTVPGCSSTSYYAVGGISANDFWIVGVGGDIRHVVGGSFTLLPQSNNVDLWAVWAVSATDAYFVGTRGTILHWNGATMLDESIGANVILSSIWGTPGDLWAVGAGGLIYRKQGNAAWAQVPSPTQTFLYWVFGTSATSVWAIGDAGVTLHYDGTSWKQVMVPATTSLRAMAAVPGGGLRMVGHGGTLLSLP